MSKDQMSKSNTLICLNEEYSLDGSYVARKLRFMSKSNIRLTCET